MRFIRVSPASGTKAITPAAINATSNVTASVQRLRPLPVAAINATSNVSASIQRLRPIPVSAINSTSTVSGSLKFLRAITPGAITATSDITATITGGAGVTTTFVFNPLLILLKMRGKPIVKV